MCLLILPVIFNSSKSDQESMKHVTLISAIALLFCISCKQAAPPVEADLAGFELTQVPGSEFYKAVQIQDSVKTQDGFVLNGRKNGIWTDYNADGRITATRHYIDGKLNGPSITFDTRSQIIGYTEYTDGVYHGLKAIYKFGRPEEEIHYKNGQIHGVMKKYYQTGKIMEEAEYNTNVLDGFYRHYSETGVIDLEYSYKNGEKISGGIVQPQEAQ
jgi:hypothetical protein